MQTVSGFNHLGGTKMNRETRMILAVYDTVILPDVDYRLNIGEISSEEKSRIKIDQNRAVILPTRTL